MYTCTYTCTYILECNVIGRYTCTPEYKYCNNKSVCSSSSSSSMQYGHTRVPVYPCMAILLQYRYGTRVRTCIAIPSCPGALVPMTPGTWDPLLPAPCACGHDMKTQVACYWYSQPWFKSPLALGPIFLFVALRQWSAKCGHVHGQ